jgi:hypothetical protein
MPRDFGLVIGLGDYPVWKRPLRGAKEDATDFYNWLCETDGGGLDPKDTQLVPSCTEPSLGPVQEEIDLALDIIKNRSAGSGRRFYFYFAGHGMGEDTDELALCLPRWSDDWRGAALCMNGYVKFVVELGHFTQVACFLDCCRVRERSIGCNNPLVKNVKPGSGAGSVERFFAYATEFDNLAYEAEVNSGGPVRGHFTRALMEGLRGAAAGPSPGASPARLAGYVDRRTMELATLNNRKQKVHIPSVPRDEAQWMFGNYPATYTVQIEFSQNLVGPISLQGPTGQVIARGTRPESSWKQPLEPAWHIIKDHGTGREKRFRVMPRTDSEVQIERF